MSGESARCLFDSVQVAAWGKDLLAKLVEESSSAASRLGECPAVPVFQVRSPNEYEQITGQSLGRLQDANVLKNAIAISDPLEVALLRWVAKERRVRGPGLFLAVFVKGSGWKARYRTLQEIKFMSAAFEKQSELELQVEARLLDTCAEFPSEERGYIATCRNVATKDFLDDLTVVISGAGRLLSNPACMMELDSHKKPYAVCSGSFGGLLASIMLSKLENESLPDCAISLLNEQGLQEWWESLPVEKRTRFASVVPAETSPAELISTIKNSALGSDVKPIDEIFSSYKEYVAQQLVLDEENSRSGTQASGSSNHIKNKRASRRREKRKQDQANIQLSPPLIEVNDIEELDESKECTPTSIDFTDKVFVGNEQDHACESSGKEAKSEMTVSTNNGSSNLIHPLINQAQEIESRSQRGSSDDFSLGTISESDGEPADMKWEQQRRKRRERKRLPALQETGSTQESAASSVGSNTSSPVPHEVRSLSDGIEPTKPSSPAIGKTHSPLLSSRTFKKDSSLAKSVVPGNNGSNRSVDLTHLSPTIGPFVIPVPLVPKPQNPRPQSQLVFQSQPVASTTLFSLHNDIREMAADLDLVATRRQPWQLAVAERAKQVIYSIWPRAWCEVFGSIATGLAAPCSDVDMVIRGVPHLARVSVLAQHLEREDWVQMVQAVERTTVPLVKFKTAAIPIAFGNRGNLISVDITFENEAHHGLNTCGIVRDFVQRWPPLKPLVLVLKQFLVEKGLNDTYVGGLSSYGLVIMVAAILKRRWPSGVGDGIPAPELGSLFVEFLETYSSPSFLEHGARVGPADSSVRSRFVGDPCYIEDPLDANNNLGRSCFGIKQVAEHFGRALQAIRAYDVAQAESSSQPTSVLGRVFATSHHIDVVRLVTKVWCPPELPSNRTVNEEDLPRRYFHAQQNTNHVPAPSSIMPSMPSLFGPTQPHPSQSAERRPSGLERWASDVRQSLVRAVKNAENPQRRELCPFCDQPVGALHVGSRCSMLDLINQYPL